MKTRMPLWIGAAALVISLGITAGYFALRSKTGAMLAPAPDPTVVHPLPETPKPVAYRPTALSLAKAHELSFTGDNPRQTGVKAGTIEVKRAAVLRGRVVNRDGDAIPGVTV